MECFYPQQIRLPDGRLQVVRCGKCLACLSHRQAEWITRLRVELEKNPETCYFVTLTYDDEHLPLNTAKFDTFDASFMDKVPSVRKGDIVTFHKDLRKRFQQGYYYDDTLEKHGIGEVEKIELPECHFSFYLTSEYGPSGHRPHYHGLYFGLPADDALTYSLLTHIWKRGFTFIERAQSDRAAAYVAKYLVNTSLVPISVHADKPFSLMSKGLGLSYLDEKRVDWHRQAPSFRSYVPHQGGKQILPRYLRDKIFDDAMRADILDEAIEREENALQSRLSLPPEELSRLEAEEHHREQEAIRQARWRFLKKGKIK